MGMKGKVCLVVSEFMVDYENDDLIVGYRADDSYFSFAQDFISNTISFDQLKKAMYLGDLGDQVVLKSERAFDQISFLNAERVSRNPWLEKKKDRDYRARKAYFSMDMESYIPGGLYITKILDEEMKRDDSRLR